MIRKQFYTLGLWMVLASGITLGLALAQDPSGGAFQRRPMPRKIAAETTQSDSGSGTQFSPLSRERPRARPTSLVLLPAEQRLIVANSSAGTLSQIDTQSGVVTGEWAFQAPGDVSAIALSPDGRHLLAVRSSSQQAILLQRMSDTEFRVLDQIETPHSPQKVCWLDQQHIAISCQWSQKLVLLDVTNVDAPNSGSPPKLVVREVLPLSHQPREMVLLGDTGRLLVIDAFDGRMSVIDPQAGKLERELRIPGHNIRGVGWLPREKRVLVAHQILNQLAETSREGVFWGIVMSNNLRLISVENFLDDQIEPLYGADIHFLGEPRNGAGDPEGLAITPNETMVIALGGVDEVAIGQHIDHSFERVPVGRRPTAVVADPAGQLAYVANSFGDSISVIDIPGRKLVRTIPLRPAINPDKLTAEERGERLYYDARLSLDSWYSCHSCHSDGHTVNLLNDNLGDGDYGAPKRIPSLLGVGETGPWLWSGNRATLQEQSRKSISTTMHGSEATDEQLVDLEAYLKTLPPPPRYPTDNPDALERGEKLFQARGCAECHVAPTYTSTGTFDVGLHDQLGRKKFNPPSLRGVRYRTQFFHDHRANSLNEVFLKHQHPRKQPWTEQEVTDLAVFLRSL